MQNFLAREGINRRYFATELGLECLQQNFSKCTEEKLQEQYQKVRRSRDSVVELSELEYNNILRCIRSSLTTRAPKIRNQFINTFRQFSDGIYCQIFMTDAAYNLLKTEMGDKAVLLKYAVDKWWTRDRSDWVVSYRKFLKFYKRIQPHLPREETVLTSATLAAPEEVPSREQVDYPLQGQLYPHQVDAIRWMGETENNNQYGFRGGILSLTQGLGKTLTSLTFALQNRGEFPQLVLVNKAIMPEWLKSIRTFYPNLLSKVLFMHSDYSDINFSAITRRQLMRFELVITTYGMARNAVALLPEAVEQSQVLDPDAPYFSNGKPNVTHYRLRTREEVDNPLIIGKGILVATPWHRIICDESQVFANPSTKIFKAIMTLYGDYKWCLTGTPIRNYETDLYAQFRYCGFNMPGARTVTEWKTFIRDNGYNDYNLGRWILIKNYEDAGVVLPPKLRQVISLDFQDPREKKVYDFVLDKAKEIYAAVVLENKLKFANLLAAIVRLRQCCVSCYAAIGTSGKGIEGYEGMETLETEEQIFEGIEDVTEWITDPMGTAGIYSTKNRELVRLVTEVIPADEKAIVFSMFVRLLDIGKTAVLEADESIPCFMIHGGLIGRERDRQLEMFKRVPGKAVLFVNYRVGSEGLNITEANHIIPLEPWWNYATHAQAEARAWRMGQTKPVHIYDIIIRDTVESHVLSICERKRQMSHDFLGPSDSIVSDSTRLSIAAIGDMLGFFG